MTVLQLNLAEIDAALEKSLAENESGFCYETHLGGGWFVSVSSDYECIDFRLWFMPAGQQ